jgi:hypothetical protein
VSEQRNILHEIRKRKANWIGHILRRNCLLKEVIEGKIKGRIKVTRRRKKLLDDLGDRRGYFHLKEEALNRIKWRNRFGRGCGPVVWQITDDDVVIYVSRFMYLILYHINFLKLAALVPESKVVSWSHRFVTVKVKFSITDITSAIDEIRYHFPLYNICNP